MRSEEEKQEVEEEKKEKGKERKSLYTCIYTYLPMARLWFTESRKVGRAVECRSVGRSVCTYIYQYNYIYLCLCLYL